MSTVSGIYDGGALPLITVVEYLETSMSRELLCKFPDNSAFDFDYAQSSIWSPLLPRAPTPDASTAVHGLEVSRRLSFGDPDGEKLIENTKKLASRIKRKFTDTVLHNVGRCTRMKRRKRKSFGFSPVANSTSKSSPKKRWVKVMKAAANYFNSRKKNHLTDGY